MRRNERIPLHNHSDGNSGGLVAAHTVVSMVSGVVSGDTGGGGSSEIGDGVFVRASRGGEEVYYNLGTLGTAATVNVVNGNWQYGTLGTACTFTFSGAASTYGVSFVLELAQDGTGGRTVTFPSAVANGTAVAASLGTAASTTTLFVFMTRDGGTSWYGYAAGASSSSSTGTSATDAYIWRPLLDSSGSVITAGAGGEAVMGYGPA